MKMLPATANAMVRNALSSLVPSNVPSNFNAVTCAVLFYTGTMPTKAELNTLFNGTQLAGLSAIYTPMNALTAARSADYVGGVAGLKPTVTLNTSNVPVLLASAMNMKLAAGHTDLRSSYFTKDAVPTWCVVIGSGAVGAVNVLTGTAGAAAFWAVCSVGNENSTADLKLVGGRVYANNSTQTDQSKAVILSDLVLKFA